MNQALKQNFDRIVAARERLLEIRAERVGTIMRLQSYLRARLDEFFTNVDPVSGARLADLGAEGSKGSGEMALILAMFDGSRLRVGVDGMGRFNHDANPNVFEDIEEIVNFDVSADFASASVDYIPAGSQSRRPVRASFDGFVDRLVQNTLETIEGEVAPAQAGLAPLSAAPAAALHVAPPLQVAAPLQVAPASLQVAPEPAAAQAAPVLHSVPEYDLPRIARPVPEEFSPAAPAYRSELPRLETERAPDPVRYSEKVRPLERPRSNDYERDVERIAPPSSAPMSELPLKPRGLSFSVR